MKKDKKYIGKILDLLKDEYPEPKTELNFKNEMQLAVAVMLSAQTTDKRVNKVTPKLFEKYPTWENLSKADVEDIKELIHSVNFYKGKSERLIKAGKKVVEDFDGNLPKDINKLIKIPGVARKSANVILQELWGIAQGVVVDTHVKRVSHRLELTQEKTPKKIEKDLMEILPQKEWRFYSGAVVLHGRYVCTARSPKCPECVLNEICPSAFEV